MTPDEVARAVAFIAAMQDALSTRRERFDGGTALFHDALPLVYELNFLRLEDPGELHAERLTAEANRLHAAAGQRHRKLEVNDARGRLLEREFVALGWTLERDVVMVQRGGAAAPARAADAVIEVDAEALRPKWEEGIRGSLRADDELVRQLLAAQVLRERATSVRYFAVRADGRLVAECSLFSDGQTAQVEAVQTLEDYRNRGFAAALVRRAVAEAGAAGHDLIFLLADDEDWPKELYARLGFEPIGHVWEFLLEPP